MSRRKIKKKVCINPSSNDRKIVWVRPNTKKKLKLGAVKNDMSIGKYVDYLASKVETKEDLQNEEKYKFKIRF